MNGWVKQITRHQRNDQIHIPVAPSASLGDILLDMINNEQGNKILQDIQIEGWAKPEEGQLKMLQMVYNQYVA